MLQALVELAKYPFHGRDMLVVRVTIIIFKIVVTEISIYALLLGAASQ